MQILSVKKWPLLPKPGEQELPNVARNISKKKYGKAKQLSPLTTKASGPASVILKRWSHGDYVANSGLIVAPSFRKGGLAKKIKKKIFELSRKKYPEAKIFGLTTGLAVMKINSELGYEPVTYSELTQDDAFWSGCKSCVNYDILMSKERKNCLCTGMLYDPKDHYEPAETTEDFKQHSKLYERFMRIKQWKLLKIFQRKEIRSSDSVANYP